MGRVMGGGDARWGGRPGDDVTHGRRTGDDSARRALGPDDGGARGCEEESGGEGEQGAVRCAVQLSGKERKKERKRLTIPHPRP